MAHEKRGRHIRDRDRDGHSRAFHHLPRCAKNPIEDLELETERLRRQLAGATDSHGVRLADVPSADARDEET